MSIPLSEIISLINDSNHSDEYKKSLIEYSQNLSGNNFPVIFDLYHLAYSIGMQPSRIINMIRDRDFLYNTYKIRKKTSGYRWIMSPTNDLKVVQKWIKINILDKVKIHESAHGFVKDKSIVSNAHSHINKEMVLNIDLYRFFDTITEKRVCSLFKKLGYTDKLSYDLARLLCINPPKNYWKDLKIENSLKKRFIKSRPSILPQGAPSSPVISNIIAFNLDKSIYKYCDKSNLTYTRYADDISISGNKSDLPSLNVIKSIIRCNGFTINNKKVKFLSAHKKQEVTGIIVNNGTFVKKELIREINQELYFCLKFGYTSHLERKFSEKEVKANYKDWLFGKICFIYSVEKTKGEKFFNKFNQIDWSI